MKRILKNEILLHKSMTVKYIRENPEFYKINCMTTAQMKVNLGILLSCDHIDCNAEIAFPDAGSMFQVFDQFKDESTPQLESDDDDGDDIRLNELNVAI